MKEKEKLEQARVNLSECERACISSKPMCMYKCMQVFVYRLCECVCVCVFILAYECLSKFVGLVHVHTLFICLQTCLCVNFCGCRCVHKCKCVLPCHPHYTTTAT